MVCMDYVCGLAVSGKPARKRVMKSVSFSLPWMYIVNVIKVELILHTGQLSELVCRHGMPACRAVGVCLTLNLLVFLSMWHDCRHGWGLLDFDVVHLLRLLFLRQLWYVDSQHTIVHGS